MGRVRRLSLGAVLSVALLALTPVSLFSSAMQDGRLVGIEDVPKAVKKTLLENSDRVIDIEEIRIGGKVFYESEVRKDGEELDLIVSADGKLLKALPQGAPAGPARPEKPKQDPEWQDTFGLEKRTFTDTGRNEYFILEPGYQLVLEGEEPEGRIKLIITALRETKVVGGVRTRVVEERETINGELMEISRNFFAIDKKTKDVFYFGEEVDDYKDGKVVGHGGAWVHGKDNARAGLFLPGKVAVGQKFYQEIAPGVAMDRVEVLMIRKDKPLKTPSGKEFKNCVVIEETTPVEPGARDWKIFAPGVGMVVDGSLALTRYGFGLNEAPLNQGRPYMGIRIDAGFEGGGVRILHVGKDTPAEKAGLRAGDLLVAADGTKLASPEDLYKVLSEAKPGQKMDVAFERLGTSLKTKITLGSAPAAGGVKVEPMSLDEVPRAVREAVEKAIPGIRLNGLASRQSMGAEVYYNLEGTCKGGECSTMVTPEGRVVWREEPTDDIPERVREMARKEIPGFQMEKRGEKITVDRSDFSLVAYKMVGTADGRQQEIQIDENGKVQVLEIILAADEIPQAVTAGAEKAVPDLMIIRAVKVTKMGRTIYEVIGNADGKAVEVVTDDKGNVHKLGKP